MIATAPAADHVVREESFRVAFDNAPGPVAMISRPGEVGGRFLRVNPAFARLLGMGEAELHLREIASVTHPEDRHLDAAVSSTDARTVRKRYLHASGRPVQVEVLVSAVRDGGTITHFINHVIDIDARIAAERAQDHASRIRRDMVSTISHELRTPLTSVQGYLEMIAGEDFGALSGEQKRMIDIAIRNAYRLEEFVTDLLMLARLDAAELDPMRHVPVDVGTVVDAAVGDVTQEAASRSHHLVVELPPAPVTVLGDAAHLKRAVQNVVANAIKYTPDGGRISIIVEALDASVRIAVADTGVGVDSDEVALLGNRFYRGVDVQRRAVGGTGLGLAITRTILDRHNGALSISSMPGEGSRFTISLPNAADRRGPDRRGAGGA